MGKISPVSAKYIINASISIDGVVDRPDVIGAIFGQTEGLLGSDLELRELQKSGRVGRIEVNVDTKTGKSVGSIIIPSSLDKAETSIVAASLEIIQRIGPCNAKINVNNIEDVRISKRSFVVERAKELLRTMMDQVLPDSQELAEEVAYSVRITEIAEYGKDKLPCGPAIDDSDEVIVVEGRADVLNLLKHGFKNVIAMNGTSVPDTIIELSKRKVLTIFVDGDRGGSLILKELFGVAEVDFITRAPDGKEVEELAKKDKHKALRDRVSAEQGKQDVDKMLVIEGRKSFSNYMNGPSNSIPKRSVAPISAAAPASATGFSSPNRAPAYQKPTLLRKTLMPTPTPASHVEPYKSNLKPEEKQKFKEMLEALIGTRGSYILDKDMNILGKVPVSELVSALKSMNTPIYAVVFDGAIDRMLTSASERIPVNYVVAMHSTVKQNETSVNVLTLNEL